jgi:hypothetical protein
MVGTMLDWREIDQARAEGGASMPSMCEFEFGTAPVERGSPGEELPGQPRRHLQSRAAAV